MRRIPALLIALALLLGTFASIVPVAQAKDVKGCEGLSRYRKNMINASAVFRVTLDQKRIDLDQDPRSISPEDWLTISKAAKRYGERLGMIHPPEWAAPWHETRIEGARLLEQLAAATARSGVMAALGFLDAFAANDEAAAAAVADATETCGDFQAFVDDFDGSAGDRLPGTPEPSPTD